MSDSMPDRSSIVKHYSYALKHVVPCKPSDWGVGMTVCIASICTRDKCIIGVSDKMLSMPAMSTDERGIKYASIGNSWIAMFAANDVSPVVPILKTVQKAAALTTCEETLEDIVGTFRSAIRKENVTKSEANVLSRFDMNMAEFRREGLSSLGPELFTRLAYEIEQISLDLTFLVFGFDGTDEREPHIFTIDGRGEVSYHDIVGFWAIGSGQTSALGTLFGTRSPLVYHSLPHILYLLARAKFSAESALGVGKDTNMLVLHANRERYLIPTSKVPELKKVWEASRGPDVPGDADGVASKLLETAKAEYLEEKEKRQANSSSAIVPMQQV
jgi:hypothetical protein